MLSRSLQIMFNVDDSTSFESIKMDTGNFSKQMDRMITKRLIFRQYKNIDNICCLKIYLVSLPQEWNDYNCIWNKTEYGDVDGIRIHPRKLWTPDLLMYNR